MRAWKKEFPGVLKELSQRWELLPVSEASVEAKELEALQEDNNKSKTQENF